MHELLQLQLERCFGTTPAAPDGALPTGWEAFLCAVSEAYARSDVERGMLADAASDQAAALLEKTRQLEAQHRRLRTLMDANLDCIISIDHRGEIIEFNRSAEETFGYTRQQILGHGLGDLLVDGPRDCREAGSEPLAAAGVLASPSPASSPSSEVVVGGVGQIVGRRVERVARHRDGREFPIEISICQTQLEGRPAFTAYVRDITERKRGECLERDHRRLLELMAQNRPLDLVLLRLAEMVERQVPGACASVLLMRDQRLTHAITAKFPPAFYQTSEGRLMRLATGLRAAVGRANGALVVGDVAGDAEWEELRDAALVAGLRCAWASPVTFPVGNGGEGADVWGILLACLPERRDPTADERELLGMACRLAAITVEQRRLGEQLVHQAHYDALTGLANRTLFEDRLQQAIGQAQRCGHNVALFQIDLDGFKYINDTLGHHVGDALLAQVAQRWCGVLRETDTLARLGGDEFGLILPVLDENHNATRVVQRLYEALGTPCQIGENELYVTASAGIAFFPADGNDRVALQRSAETAMYRAKNLGRNRYQCFAPEMNALATEKLELEGQLRRAVAAGDFELFYQPQVDRAGGLIGLEALLRWKHPKHGYISPARFIPLAEETGLIVPIGTWTLNEACRQALAWQQAGHPPVRVAVNVSALQFAQADFIAVVAGALSTSGLDARWLELEVTESLLMQHMQDVIDKLARVRERGIGVAVDDFGTGYSSLAYLQRLPLDLLKIDRSFVKEIGPGALLAPTGHQTAVIRAIISLAKSLGLGVMAEGVETEQQRQFLTSQGCDGLQGFLFSKPLPPADVTPIVAAGRVPWAPPEGLLAQCA